MVLQNRKISAQKNSNSKPRQFHHPPSTEKHLSNQHQNRAMQHQEKCVSIPVSRIRAITLLRDAHWSPQKVARLVNYSTRTLKRWKERLRQDPEWDGSDLPRSGRPPTITGKISKKIQRHMKGKRHHSLRATVKHLSKRGIQLTSSGLQQHLRTKTDLKPFRPIRTPQLSKEKKKKRVEFAQLYLDHPWDRTLITDEKFFGLCPPLNAKNDVVWDDKPGVNRVKRWKAPGVQVWGGISHWGKTDLVFLEGKKDSDGYLDQCIYPQLPKIRCNFGHRTWWLQQDGARKHTSRTTLAALQAARIHVIPPHHWPPNSPDLSCIENLWGYLEVKIWEKKIKTKAQLRRRLTKVWNALDLAFIRHYTSTTRSRLQKVIAGKGEKIA